MRALRATESGIGRSVAGAMTRAEAGLLTAWAIVSGGRRSRLLAGRPPEVRQGKLGVLAAEAEGGGEQQPSPGRSPNGAGAIWAGHGGRVLQGVGQRRTRPRKPLHSTPVPRRGGGTK